MTNGRSDGRIAALANAMTGTQSDSGGSANNSPSSSASGARRRAPAPARPSQPPSRPTPGKILTVLYQHTSRPILCYSLDVAFNIMWFRLLSFSSWDALATIASNLFHQR